MHDVRNRKSELVNKKFSVCFEQLLGSSSIPHPRGPQSLLFELPQNKYPSLKLHFLYEVIEDYGKFLANIVSKGSSLEHRGHHQGGKGR